MPQAADRQRILQQVNMFLELRQDRVAYSYMSQRCRSTCEWHCYIILMCTVEHGTNARISIDFRVNCQALPGPSIAINAGRHLGFFVHNQWHCSAYGVPFVVLHQPMGVQVGKIISWSVTVLLSGGARYKYDKNGGGLHSRHLLGLVSNHESSLHMQKSKCFELW